MRKKSIICGIIIIHLGWMVGSLAGHIFNKENFTVVYFPKFKHQANISESATSILSKDLDIILDRFNVICVYFNGYLERTLIPTLVAKKNIKANETNSTHNNIPRYQVRLALDLTLPDYYESVKTLITASDNANSIYQSTVQTIMLSWHVYKTTPNDERIDFHRMKERLANITGLIHESKYRYKTVGLFYYNLHVCHDIKTLEYINSVTNYLDAVNFHSPRKGKYSNGACVSMANDIINDYEKCKQAFRNVNKNVDIGFVTEFLTNQLPALHDCEVVCLWKLIDQWVTSSKTSVVLHEAFDLAPERRKLYRGYTWWQVKLSERKDNFVYEEKALRSQCSSSKTTTQSRQETTTIQSRQETTALESRKQTTITESRHKTTTKELRREKTTPTHFEIDSKLNSHTASKSTLAPLIAFVTVFLAASFLSVYLCVSNRLANSRLIETEIRHFVDGVPQNAPVGNFIPLTPLSLPYEKDIYELEPGTFVVEGRHLLGEGVQGTVCRAQIYKNGATIIAAAKTVKNQNSMKAKLVLLSEIKVLSYLGSHQNILELYGAYTGSLRKDKVIVFTELCALGSLDKLLTTYKENLREGNELRPGYTLVLSMPDTHLQLDEHGCSNTTVREIDQEEAHLDMKRWSYEIANGMEYLAEKNVVHIDLATRNVLITERKQAKIADFGLSRRLYNLGQYVKTQDQKLPWQWMAPEALKKLVFNEKTDVWSYGITLWEIFTLGDNPYSGIEYGKAFVSSLFAGLKLESPHYNLNDVYTIMLECWQIDPDARPDFETIKQKVVQKFGSLYEN